MMERLVSWDTELMVWLNGMGNPNWDAAMVFVSSEMGWLPSTFFFLGSMAFSTPGRVLAWGHRMYTVCCAHRSDQRTRFQRNI